MSDSSPFAIPIKVTSFRDEHSPLTLSPLEQHIMEALGEYSPPPFNTGFRTGCIYYQTWEGENKEVRGQMKERKERDWVWPRNEE